MTEFERAKQGLTCASVVWDEHYERAGIPVPGWVGEQLAYWQTRVRECERRVAQFQPAEKEAEPFAAAIQQRSAEAPMDHRVGEWVATLELEIRRLERITNSANAKIERLESRFQRHQHDFRGRTVGLVETLA